MLNNSEIWAVAKLIDMIKRALISAFLLSAARAFAQLDSNSVTVSASQNAAAQADSAYFSVNVFSSVNASLADVQAALQGSPISAPDFTGINGVGLISNPFPTSVPQPQGIQWRFALTVPLSKIKDTSALLTSLQKSIVQNNSGLTLSFSLQGTQVSAQAQQSVTCSVTDLLSDARTQAPKIAEASVLTLGPILAISGSTSPAPVCFITVKFGLVRF